jgi:tetratricopeptide (TPR) repeat protein
MPVAAQLAGRGHLSAGRTIAQGLVRPLWPVTVLAIVFLPWRRLKLALVAGVLAPSIIDWIRTRPDIAPLPYVALRLADDMAYGAGVWVGSVRAGTLEPNALLSLGHLYLQSDLPELALERYRAALASTNPPSPTRAVESLELFLSRSDWPLAKEYVTTLETVAGYREALDPAKGEKDLLSRLTRARAVLELETGDAATGAKRIEEWLRREPLDGECLLLLARFREEAGQKVEAAMLLEQAARIPATAAGALLAHGRLLVAAADYEKALEQLEKSQELSPNASLSDYIAAIRELVGGASVR